LQFFFIFYKVDQINGASLQFLPRDVMHKRGLCCHAVSVRLSVRHVRGSRHVKTNKHIFEIFSPSGSDTIPSQRGCQYSDGNPPNGGVECKGYDKMTIFSQISHCISETVIARWAHVATSETICKHLILFPSIHLA